MSSLDSVQDALIGTLNLGTMPTIPKGHGTYSYYKPQYALRVKAWLDAMLENKTRNAWVDAAANRVSAKTLLQWYKQGLGFLVTNYPDSIYVKLYPKIAVKAKAKGLLLVWLSNVGYDPDFARNSVQTICQDVAGMLVWREKLQTFLETALPREQLSMTGLALTPKEVENVKVALSISPDFLFEVANDRIIVTRLGAESDTPVELTDYTDGRNVVA